nr:beta-1,2-xylosyltransferase 1 [Quercus suber]
MDRTTWLLLGGFIAGIVRLTQTTPTTFVFDKPVHTAICLSATLSITLLLGSRTFLKFISSQGKVHERYDYGALSLESRGDLHSPTELCLSPTETVSYASRLPTLKLSFLIIVAAVPCRALLWQHILTHWECATSGWTPLLPLACTVLDFGMRKRHEPAVKDEDDPDSSIYDAIIDKISRSQYRHILAALLVGLGGLLATFSTGGPHSTYICATTGHDHWLVPVEQVIGFVLDIVVILCVGQLLHQRDHQRTRNTSAQFFSTGWALLVEQVHRYGVLTTSIMATFVTTSSMVTVDAWSHSHPFPPVPTVVRLLAICLTVAGFALYLPIETASEQRSSSPAHQTILAKPTMWSNLCLLALLCLHITLWMTQSNTVNYHPIDMLLYEAQLTHNQYRNQSMISQTLSEATRRYKEKYNQYPPPGFQHWYNFASARNSIIIDEFDTIYKDLLPFSNLSPKEIRQQTWDLISNPWHEAGGISIRNGQASVSPHVPGTHAWMLEGVIEMINKFVQWLPDMDLAFNINDEPRVAVPFDQLEKSQRRTFDRLQRKPLNGFSDNRGAGWEPLPDLSNAERIMEDFSFQRTFYEFGSIGCPTASTARLDRVWDVSTVCNQCTAPHSLGAFLSNWSLAADVCHQPDLANLHGLYLSPAAFKPSHNLLPVFSQSKAHGFNDIIYPSPWNYLDKVKFEPTADRPDVPFETKDNTLFWRGATSEGVSSGGGQWQGMTRQRFVHFAHTIKASAKQVSLLIPDMRKGQTQRLTYENVPSYQVSELVSTDVQLVDTIARCGGRDCPDQTTEFAPFASGVDFQDHWRYKYLLDLDGAGFSGRFLPFLHSTSLPFKAALFREWWDDRVTPWQHFVPLDLRGHGFWATLTYFTGLDGKINGRDVQIEGHTIEAQRIAERGKKWAELVLRKEDMEIYMFRLLLEWGRITDDRRDEIGFDV